MIGEKRGQVSFEYLLIVTVSLIILIVFTMPLANQTMAATSDVSYSIMVKSDMSKIVSAIDTVYGEGQGAKQTVTIISAKRVNVDIENDHLSCNLNLNKGSKNIKLYYNSNLKSSSLYLNKGENIIVVEWPADDKMLIYKEE